MRSARDQRQLPSTTPVGPALHRALAPTEFGRQPSRDGQYALDLPWRSLAGLFYPTFCRLSPRRSQPLTGLVRSLQDRSGALQTFLPSSHFFCAKLPHAAFLLSITWTLPHLARFSFILPLPSITITHPHHPLSPSRLTFSPSSTFIFVALSDFTISSHAHCPVLIKTGLCILHEL